MIVIKSPTEIERMRVACSAAAEILAAVAREIQPGRTTAELDAVAAEMTEIQRVSWTHLRVGQ